MNNRYRKFVSVLIGLIFMVIGYNFLFPTIIRTTPHGNECESHLKEISTCLETYATDNRGRYPPSLEYLTSPSPDGKFYIKKIPVCSPPKPTFWDLFSTARIPQGYGYKCSANPDNFTLWCGKPQGHADMSSKPKKGAFPQYSPVEGLIVPWER